MNRMYLLAITSFLLLSSSAIAQDSCKLYSIKNPHGAQMSIDSMWVLDPVNFTVESVLPMPYVLGSKDTLRAVVCILARDGQSRSTQVRYKNTHGISSFNVTMVAPTGGSSSVDERTARTVELKLSPNPASDYVSIAISSDMLSADRVVIYNTAGERVQSVSVEASAHVVTLDVTGLPSGRYVASIEGKGRHITTAPLVIEH